MLGFNLGVEAGQLTVLAVVFPWLWLLRHRNFFQRLLLPGFALVIVIAGAVWLFARAADVDIISFAMSVMK